MMSEQDPTSHDRYCEVYDDNLPMSKLCSDISQKIIEAGGAGAFEASICPFNALGLILESETEVAREIRRKLGVSRVGNDDGRLD